MDFLIGASSLHKRRSEDSYGSRPERCVGRQRVAVLPLAFPSIWPDFIVAEPKIDKNSTNKVLPPRSFLPAASGESAAEMAHRRCKTAERCHVVPVEREVDLRGQGNCTTVGAVLVLCAGEDVPEVAVVGNLMANEQSQSGTARLPE